MPASKRGVVLCADDFGLSEGVSAGILDLADRGRISATSVMTNAPAWGRFGGELRSYASTIGVGLHFTLTGGRPLGAMPGWAPGGMLPAIDEAIRRALTGTAPLDEIEVELERQLATFEQVFGRGPDFLDGHQHVHTLPGIRSRVLRVLAHRTDRGRIWLRDPSQPIASLRRDRTLGKALAVRVLSLGFGRAADHAGFETNNGFSGFSAFDRDPDTAGLFERAFHDLGRRPLVMCHPGRPEGAGAGLDDVIESRPRELAYLMSPAFADLLERLGLELVSRPTGGG